MSEEMDLEGTGNESLSKEELLAQDLKANAEGLGIIVESGLEEGLQDFKRYLASLLAGVALNAVMHGPAAANVDCMIAQDAVKPTIKCELDPDELQGMPDDLVMPAVKDLFDKDRTDLETREAFGVSEDLVKINFVKEDTSWRAYLNIGDVDMEFNVDPNYTEKLDQGYEDEKSALASGEVTYDNELNLGSEAGVEYAAADTVKVESANEDIAAVFNQCLTEMVEKNTFDHDKLHDAFIAALQ